MQINQDSLKKRAIPVQVTKSPSILLNWIMSSIEMPVGPVLMVKAWIIYALHQQAPQETEKDPGQKKIRRN